MRRIRISGISLVRRYRSFVCSSFTSYYIGRNLISGFSIFYYFIHLDSCPCVNVNGFQCFFELGHIHCICIVGTSCYIDNLSSHRATTNRYSSCCGTPSGYRYVWDDIRCKSSFAASYSIRYRTYSDSYSALCSYRRTIPNSHRIICTNSIVISQRNHIFSIH